MALNSETRQRLLTMLLSQISQNLNNVAENSNISINLPGIDLGITLPDLIPSPPTEPGTPGSIKEVLSNLLNKQAAVTTAFDTVTGTVAAVKDDYVAMIEGDGSQVLIPFDQIESVSEQ
ncbi:DUF2642 domain-containing protein [Pueribacillus theae]|uniref:DUF2642 domain-containing protein n=1 Tax=Pueribacillus theae TaxID=2171751 RepID=UPI001057E529|nr:DUF2642 domain-containing protein [Pueribacillus theae]